MLALSGAIGYSYQYLGLYAAISFHFIFDLVVLIVVKNSTAKEPAA
jgi:hypothetical protein